MMRTRMPGVGAAVAVLGLLLVPLPATLAAQKADPTAPGFTPKLTAPIGISHTVAAEPRQGEPLEITLTVTADEAIAGAVLSVTTEDALSVIDPTADVELGTLGPGQSATVTLTVIPLAGGSHYLNVSVTGDVRGRPQTRSIAVPVRLADTAPQKSDDGTAGNKGESVRSFPAVERIR